MEVWMNIVQLVYKKTGDKIGSIRIYFVVKGVGIFHNPKGAFRAVGPFKKISVVIIGKLYSNLSSKEKESTSIEIKKYSFLERKEFAKDFGLKIKNRR
jgi:hypothetical protein